MKRLRSRLFSQLRSSAKAKISETPSQSTRLTKQAIRWLRCTWNPVNPIGMGCSQQIRMLVLSSLIATGVVLGLRMLGLLQLSELTSLDWLLRSRPVEPKDNRIIIVGISEQDIQTIGEPNPSDQVVAQLIRQIRAQKPKVIGLDLYRNLPMEPGHRELAEVFRETPNLIGIEKVIGDRRGASIPGNSVLVATKRIAASDVIPDIDGRVRRGFLFPNADGTNPLESLPLRLALEYLAQRGIRPDTHSDLLTFNGVTFPAIQPNAGGYVNTDAGGYQILLNPRGGANFHPIVWATHVLNHQVPANIFRDRIVLIGNISPIGGDVFFTSYSAALSPIPEPIYGVEVHADLVSQIISSVLDGRPLIHVFPKWVEAIAMLLLAIITSLINAQRHGYLYHLQMTLGLILATFGVSYGLLWVGWWFPLIPSLMVVGLAASMVTLLQNQSLNTLATRDGLTQLLNRRIFDEYLRQEWHRAARSQSPLSLIICDVDYFKRYNDSYGHLQGDDCLRQVATVLKHATKRRSDIVARYGGEEFVVLLPHTDSQGALQVAELMRQSVHSLRLEHRSSDISPFVTISLGVTTVTADFAALPISLINLADLGLYEAKRRGRNQVALQLNGFSNPDQDHNDVDNLSQVSQPNDPGKSHLVWMPTEEAISGIVP